VTRRASAGTARTRARFLIAAALLAAALQAPCRAGSVPASAALSNGYCDPGRPLSAEQKDTLLRFGAVVKAELERSGASVALIARSGLDLRRFEMRYSHAGVSLKASPETPWAVRQLYYACDEKVPRIFDQGMSAFLMGTDDASIGYVSIVFLPAAEAAALERRALDNRLALALLAGTYSANAYPFSTRYQNCNQWVMELLASAWGAPDPLADGDPVDAADDAAQPARRRAQRWLQAQGYAPTVFEVGWLMGASTLIPWLKQDDHPAADLDGRLYRVSMPDSIEAFVRQRLPGATRIELCHDSRQVVLRRGWGRIAAGCRPGEGDTVMPLP
jgi:hypothetical protein